MTCLEDPKTFDITQKLLDSENADHLALLKKNNVISCYPYSISIVSKDDGRKSSAVEVAEDA